MDGDALCPEDCIHEVTPPPRHLKKNGGENLSLDEGLSDTENMGIKLREPDACDYFMQLPVDLPRFPGILVPADAVVTIVIMVG